MAFPVLGSPSASPTVRKDQEIQFKSDYPSMVPPTWPEVTSPPSPQILHDDFVPGDDAIDELVDNISPLSQSPSAVPSDMPSMVPSDLPSMVPSDLPSMVPSDMPSMVPSVTPSSSPSFMPTFKKPSTWPSSYPTVVFEAFGNVIVDDAPHGDDGFGFEQQNYLPETPAPGKGRPMKSKKRRILGGEKPPKQSKVIRLLRSGLGRTLAEQP